MNTNTTPFREAALKQMASPEQLDQLLQVVTFRAWVIAGTVYALLFFIVAWSIFGSVSTRADGKGILLAGGGDIYNAVSPDGPSHVNTILVKVGEKVTKGQIVATLSRPDLVDQIQVTRNYLSKLQNQYNQLQVTSKTEIATRVQQTTDQQQSLQRSFQNSQQKLGNLQQLLAIKQAAFKRGIETRQSVDQTFQDFYNVKSEVASYDNQLVQLSIAQNSFNDQWRERLRELQLKITDETAQLQNLLIRLKMSTDVQSPVDGVVTNAQATVGSIVNTGDPLVSVASQGKGLDALVYLPPHVGKQVKPGMQALVTPTSVEKAEYGSIYGSVISVAAFPSTPQAILAALQNQDLVKQFTRDEVPIEVRIRLQNDPNTYSNLKWSSSKGPQQLITSGTLVSAMVTVRKQKPITLVIPAFKKLTGMQ
ncbi:MAG TPA: NHLP bacteriocin system secretion protein [Gammaproteobacteria bacterium]|nr:NHLP bacteriocin system secretion protein [Gammaproteobacteria bacterium]